MLFTYSNVNLKVEKFVGWGGVVLESGLVLEFHFISQDYRED